MARKRIPNVKIENAELLFRNFRGAPDKFNPDGGVRQFAVKLTPELAEAMIEDGWNVRTLKANPEYEEPEQPYVQVKVSYRYKAPRVVFITNAGTDRVARNALNEELVGLADHVNIAKADLIINPSFWTKGPNSGITAYLQSIFITIEVDELEEKYADIPELEYNKPPLQIEAGPGEDDMLDLESEYLDEMR